MPDLVRRGLLLRVESPLEPTVETSVDGLREIESRPPLCSGVPRKEVLGLREETAAAAVTIGSGRPRSFRPQPHRH